MDNNNYTDLIRQMANQRQTGALEAPAPAMAATQRSAGIEQIANSVSAAEEAAVKTHRQAKRAYAGGGALNTDDAFFQDNSQSGLDKRLAQMQGQNAAASSSGFAALPDTPSVAQTMAAGAANGGFSPSSPAQGMLDSIAGNSALSGRQKAQAAMALNTNGALDTSGIRGMSAKQNMLLGVDQFNADAGIKRQKLAFADGGKIDPEALLAQMKSKYGGVSTTPQPQSPAPQQPAPQPQAQAPGSSLVQGAANALRGRAAQIDKAAGYNRGGKIKGPGTATSDSIPAKVKQTGENILVSNGERILSAKQDQLLHRIAQERGFESVDAMLEHGTGEPVGPTIKAGKKAAANGYRPSTLTDQNRHASGEITENPNLPNPPAEEPPIDVAAASKNFNSVFSDADFQKPKPWYAGTDSRDERAGLEMERERRAAADPETLKNDIVKSALVYGVVGSQTPLPPQALATPEKPAAQPTPPTAGAMAAESKGTPAQEPAAPIQSPLAGGLTTKDIVPGGYTDRGAGIVGSRDGRGQLNVTNVGTGNVANPSSPIMDGSASALIDQKNSTYNPAAQLERMQRSRMVGDLTNPEITDPNVVKQAALALTAMNGGAKANLEGAQADLVRANTNQAQQMEQMRGKLLDPSTPPEVRTQMLQTLQAIGGHTQRTAPYQVHDVETPIDQANPLLGNRKVPHRFNPNTGALEPFGQSEQQGGDAFAQAKAAIARGANKAAVNARLRSLNLPEIK